MARLLIPHSDGPYPARVLDPACGSGGLLAAAARHGASGLFAQDLLPVQAQRTAVRLRFRGSTGRGTGRATPASTRCGRPRCPGTASAGAG